MLPPSPTATSWSRRTCPSSRPPRSGPPPDSRHPSAHAPGRLAAPAQPRRAHTSGDRIAGVPHPRAGTGRSGRRRQPKGAPMPVVTRRELLEAGVHFGHQTRRWNPKMQRYLFGERSGIYIIDLERSLAGLEETHDVRPGPRASPRDRPVHRDEEASPGGRRRARRAASACPSSTTAGSAACSPTSRRSAAVAAAARAPRDGDHRRDGKPPEEGGHPPAPRAREAGTQPRRHPGRSSGFPTRSS